MRAFLRLVRVGRELDPARLAASTGEHLGLDDDRAAEHLCRLPRLAGRGRQAPLGDRDADPAEQLLALVLVEIHAAREAIEEPLRDGPPPAVRPRRVCEHCRVQRPVAVLVALGAVLLVTGCSSGGAAPVIPSAAPPQAAELAWVERSPATGPALVFSVRRFAVTDGGWTSDVEIENRSGIPWALGADPVAVEQSFGIMLFATGDIDELERRNQSGDLPGLRAARRFDPALPARLEPGASWRGTISAPGSLAAGRWVRVVFGPLVAVGDPPDGMPARFVWITDHAHRLRARP